MTLRDELEHAQVRRAEALARFTGPVDLGDFARDAAARDRLRGQWQVGPDAVLAAFVPLDTLVNLTSMGTLIAFAIVSLGVIILRRTQPDLPRGYRVPLYPVVPALGIVTCIALIFTVESRVLVFFAWYTLGAIILYFIYGMHNSRLAKGLDNRWLRATGAVAAAGGAWMMSAI